MLTMDHVQVLLAYILRLSVIIIIIKNEKIRVTLCENTVGALYIVNKTVKTVLLLL